MSDKVISKHTAHLKSKDRVAVAGNIHYHSGKMQWYLYPRLGSVANYAAQPLIVRLSENLDRPSAFCYGIYYFKKYNDCQEWVLIRTNGDGQLNYGDEFRLRNCYYKSSYLREYYSNKWKMYYFTTTKDENKATDWYFHQYRILEQ